MMVTLCLSPMVSSTYNHRVLLSNVYYNFLFIYSFIHHSDELKQGIEYGIKVINISTAEHDLIGSSKCPTDGRGKIMNDEDIRKLLFSRSASPILDEEGKLLGRRRIKYVAVKGTPEDFQKVYDSYTYERDGPVVLSFQTSRDTDQDSAWELEMNHQEHSTKNDIKNHIESNRWRRGGRSNVYCHSVATIVVYKDFVRAVRDTKQPHRFNQNAMPDLIKRFQHRYGKSSAPRPQEQGMHSSKPPVHVIMHVALERGRQARWRMRMTRY